MAFSLDRAVFNFLTRKWDEAAIREYPARLQQHEAAIPAPVLATFQTLDTKAAGLLTHVSMMVAGLGLIAPLVANHNVELAIILFEMGVYLLLGIGCLRCLSVFRPAVSGADLQDYLAHELVLRRELYILCIRVAIVFTIVVFITLPVMYIW